jgi:multidrug resistance efflux pump
VSAPAAPEPPAADGAGEANAVPAEAFQALSTLHQVSLEAFLSSSEQELVFRMLNRSVALVPYGRAVLWSLEGGRPEALGVSGKSDLNKRSPLMQTYARLVERLTDRQTPRQLGPEDTPGAEEEWRELVGEGHEARVWWQPVQSGETLVAGLWLERWSGHPEWSDRDARMLGSLTVAYGAAWEKLVRRTGWTQRLRRSLTRTRMLVVAAALVLALVFLRVPLRITAPCEVIPREPQVVAAPLDGVIAEIKVEPGDPVEEGDLLFVYDSRGVDEELAVAAQQVRIISSNLERAKVLSLGGDAESRAELIFLQNRLAQEKIRLAAARERHAKLQVRAPAAGVVLLDDPDQWSGRPVRVGERVLSVVDPARTQLAIWLPEDDNIPFDEEQPVQVFLSVAPHTTLTADLAYIARHVTLTPEGVPSFRAEATWRPGKTPAGESLPLSRGVDIRIGLTGQSVLYGERVSLGYWLARKPLAALRRFFGF